MAFFYNLKDCPRCGYRHTLLIRTFYEPVVIGGDRWPLWAKCPITKEPIIARYIGNG